MTQPDHRAVAQNDRPLSYDGRRIVFRKATRRFSERYADQIAMGMTDSELGHALEDYLGIFGGSGGPEAISIAFQGAGLKIWGAWQGLNHITQKPLFQGKATIAMAREMYGITDPQSDQLTLF